MLIGEFDSLTELCKVVGSTPGFWSVVMLKSMIVGVEMCGNSSWVGLILRGISRGQIREMLDKYAVVIVRKRKNDN